VGCGVGTGEGSGVGKTVGTGEGSGVGSGEGTAEGSGVGAAEGDSQSAADVLPVDDGGEDCDGQAVHVEEPAADQ